MLEEDRQAPQQLDRTSLSLCLPVASLHTCSQFQTPSASRPCII